MAFFEELGVPLKTERGNRVFPVSDRAADVIDALFHMKKLNIPVTQARASQICLEEDGCPGWRPIAGFFPCRAAVLATGGYSYPATGSTGDGYEMPGPWAILWSRPFHPWSPWRQRRTSAEKCRAWR